MTASPGGWSRVRELFDRAIALPAASRSDLVEELAGGDDALRNDVLELLRQYDSKDPGFKSGIDAFFNREPDVSTGEWVGRRIGPYRVVREIGRGGMGTVYEAERDDAEYAKRVAIKLLRPGMQSDALIQRFRRERQILAGLEHPNIARLLDGGMASDERPFLVMEYFEGRPLDRYCDEQRLPVRERVALFIEVCGAVEYAHRNLVVHRDLKPGNVLVTNDGVPKLLDFGVAKLLLETGVPSDTTTVEGRFLTPEYASPEQLREEPVTTVSDVYSLGLMLYELLAGYHPFRAFARAPSGFERILTTDPARPSTTVTEQAAAMRAEHDATRLRKRLDGELDNIVMAAIRKEPARRYASVQSLADDLRRYLNGEPVSAQKDTRLYRARKFAARNRGAVAAAVVVAASMIAGMSATLWQADRARAESVRAEGERDKAERITEFLQNMIGAGDPSWYTRGARPGPSTTILDAVNQVAGRVSEQFEGQPDAEASIRRTIGNTYQALGMADSAEPHLRVALARRRTAAAGPTLDLARDLRDLAAARIFKGDFKEAERLLREALSVHAAIGDSTSSHLAIATNDLSVALARSGDLAAAEPLAVRTLALVRLQYGDSHASVANALNNLGYFASARGDLAASERYLVEALDMYDRLGGREFVERGATLFNLGVLRKWRGAHAGADSLLRESLALFVRTAGPQHPYVMLAWTELAYNHYLAGQLGAAESDLAQARAFARARSVPDSHPDMARLATPSGLVNIARGRPQAAEQELRRALAVRKRAHGELDARTMETMGVLGLALGKLGRAGEAAPLLRTAREGLQAKFGNSDPRSIIAAGWEREGTGAVGIAATP